MPINPPLGRVCNGPGNPGKSLNLKKLFSRPGKPLNFEKLFSRPGKFWNSDAGHLKSRKSELYMSEIFIEINYLNILPILTMLELVSAKL